MRAKLEAEAEGNDALLSQRARGLKELVETAGSPEQAFALLLVDMVPTLVEKAAEAEKGVNTEAGHPEPIGLNGTVIAH